MWPHSAAIRVRLLGKDGRYPAFQVETANHLLSTSSGRCWAAVVQPELDPEWEWSERVTLSPEEIRLYAAVTLPEPDPWEKGLLIITHWAQGELNPGSLGWDLRSAELRERLEGYVAELLLAASGEPLRPVVPGPYSLGKATGSLTDTLELLESIDVNDQLLLAGLSRLLQASRLGGTYDGPEDSCLPLFVSMGSAMEFIRLHLSHERGSEQPMREVYEYLRESFPYGDEVVEYFEEMYDYRVLTIHPASRLGEYWTPPLMVGDVYHLRKSLMSLYRHILTGRS